MLSRRFSNVGSDIMLPLLWPEYIGSHLEHWSGYEYRRESCGTLYQRRLAKPVFQGVKRAGKTPENLVFEDSWK